MNLKAHYDVLKKRFAESGIDTAALDARLLMCYALEISHEDFILQSERALLSEEIEKIDNFVLQRLQRKPVAKIIGEKEFYGRSFMTNEHTLDPRPDSEILIESVLKYKPESDMIDVLDLGTGTGCLLVTLLAECTIRPRAIGTAVDASIRALTVAQENAERYNVADRIVFVHGNWFDKVKGGPYHVIISNPPYIPSSEIEMLAPEVRDYDPKEALDGGTDGLDPYRLIAARAEEFLHPEGIVAFEVGQGQARDVADILQNHGFQSPVIVNDLAGIARVVLAKRP